MHRLHPQPLLRCRLLPRRGLRRTTQHGWRKLDLAAMFSDQATQGGFAVPGSAADAACSAAIPRPFYGLRSPLTRLGLSLLGSWQPPAGDPLSARVEHRKYRQARRLRCRFATSGYKSRTRSSGLASVPRRSLKDSQQHLVAGTRFRKRGAERFEDVARNNAARAERCGMFGSKSVPICACACSVNG